jgi:hypothetical protein
MYFRQRGAVNLYWVALLSAGAAALAMAALMSMRAERNLLTEGAGQARKAFDASGARKALKAASDRVTGTDSGMKRCVIGGKTVVSNTDCAATNKSTRAIVITEGNIADEVKAPKEASGGATSDPTIDKIIQKQLN